MHMTWYGTHRKSFKWVKEMQETAEALDDPVLRIAAPQAITSNLWNGHLQEVRRHGDSVVALYDADQGRRIETHESRSPYIARGGEQPVVLLGYPEQALRLREEADLHARAALPSALRHADPWQLDIQLRGEPEPASHSWTRPSDSAVRTACLCFRKCWCHCGGRSYR
jgi:hypothetical protein